MVHPHLVEDLSRMQTSSVPKQQKKLGVIFSALEVVNFLFGVLRVLHKHLSVEFLD